MARISMRNVQKSSVSEYFDLYLSSAAARGVKDKTLQTYRNHFRSISKRMDATIPMNRLNSQDLEDMILRMREEGLSASSINSYTRTLKVFFSWCNEEGHSSLNIKLYKAPETVKETYTDEELLILLKKPEANCNFCEYRNWVIINFLLNSGCRAATVRNIQIQDVDLLRKQIVLRHTKNGKVQVIPLCSSMVAILRDYMAVRAGKGSDYLFCNEFGDFLTENAYSKQSPSFARMTELLLMVIGGYVHGGNCTITTRINTHISKLFGLQFCLIAILRVCMILKLPYRSVLI